jgi:hypothetical protein
VVENLLNIHETLGSMLSTAKENIYIERVKLQERKIVGRIPRM